MLTLSLVPLCMEIQFAQKGGIRLQRKMHLLLDELTQA